MSTIARVAINPHKILGVPIPTFSRCNNNSRVVFVRNRCSSFSRATSLSIENQVCRKFGFPSSLFVIKNRGLAVRALGGEEEKNEVVEEELNVSDEDPELGYVKTRLPKEFRELLKYSPDSPNYLLFALTLVILFTARKAVVGELLRWCSAIYYLAVTGIDLTVLGVSKLIELGGDPAEIILAVLSLAVTFIVDAYQVVVSSTPIRALSESILLSVLVLNVGETVADASGGDPKSFLGVRVVDIASLIGLAGVLGVIPGVFVPVCLCLFTVYLLKARNLSPLAAVTPAAFVVVAIAGQLLRYTVLFSFLGFAVYCYSKLPHPDIDCKVAKRKWSYPLVVRVAIVMVCLSACVHCLSSHETEWRSLSGLDKGSNTALQEPSENSEILEVESTEKNELRQEGTRFESDDTDYEEDDTGDEDESEDDIEESDKKDDNT